MHKVVFAFDLISDGSETSLYDKDGIKPRNLSQTVVQNVLEMTNYHLTFPNSLVQLVCWYNQLSPLLLNKTDKFLHPTWLLKTNIAPVIKP